MHPLRRNFGALLTPDDVLPATLSAAGSSPRATVLTETMPAGPSGRAAMLAETVQAGPSVPGHRVPGACTAALLPEVDPARYVVSGQIAQGGIGRVLRAEDVQMQRPVALKELLDRDAEAEDRFVREALLTSRLQHPSIVPVYEAGRWPTGAPFIAMKLVSGRSLAQVIEEPRGLDERLPLVTHVLAVAQAMAYAHAEGIIHRDLKPANVLVGDFGETVVIDWGLAKELSGTRGEGPQSLPPGKEIPVDEAAAGALTVAGAVVGTPAYMPPEQASGLPVDERADVYAVGAMLYHLLSGAAPYEGTARAVVGEVLRRPPEPLTARTRGVPEDLLAIVDKAMARKPEDRYPSARELAEDLGRFHAGQLVGAHRYSRRELAVRFVRRHRGALSVALAALLVLVAGGIYGVLRVMAARDREAGERVLAERARAQAEEARQAAVARADQLVLVQARTALEKDPNEALGWLRSLSPSFEDWGTVRRIAADAEGRGLARALRGHEKYINIISYAPDGKALYSASDDHTVRAWDLTGDAHQVMTEHGDEAWRVSVSPDGKLIATASKDREIRVVDAKSGVLLRTLRGHEYPVVLVLFTLDGQALVSAADDMTVRRWDLRTGEHRVLCRGTDGCAKIEVAPDRRYAVVSGSENHPLVSLLDLETGALQRAPGVKVFADHLQLMGNPPTAVLSEGKLVVAGTGDGRLQLWNPATGEVRVYADHDAPVMRVVFSPDGRRLASADMRGVVRVRDLVTGASQVSHGHQGSVSSLAFSPDGRWLASASVDHTARLWDLQTDQQRVLQGARDALVTVVIAPDGRSVATAGGDGVVRVYRLDSGSSTLLGQHDKAACSLDLAPGGGRVATGGADGTVRIWSLEGGAPRTLSGHEGTVERVRFSPDGKLLASADTERSVRVWSAEGQALHVLEGTAREDDTRWRTPLFAFSPDGAVLAAGGAANLRLLRLETGAVRELRGLSRTPREIAFSADGRQVGATSRGSDVWLWETASGEGKQLEAHRDRGGGIAFSPTGRLVATGAEDHMLHLSDLASGSRRTIHAGGYQVTNLEFARSGDYMLGITGLSVVQVWSAKDGSVLHVLRGHEGDVRSAHIADDERSVITTGVDGTVRVWDLATAQAQVLRGHAGTVFDARFLPEGRGFVSVGQDGTVRLWRDGLPRDAEGLRAWIAEAVQTADPRMAGAASP
ncbi:protein kinase domain-containing protein [Chondromyces apiculatus]|uniref:protein kinase domain-containing protein n=1 Tax=Chondromyces apiculatus TaxID=51 RepID=UPI0018CC7925|nr:protein kinase [Chondromyces apiculatus]